MLGVVKLVKLTYIFSCIDTEQFMGVVGFLFDFWIIKVQQNQLNLLQAPPICSSFVKLVFLFFGWENKMEHVKVLMHDTLFLSTESVQIFN